jgi:hypothetical protein
LARNTSFGQIVQMLRNEVGRSNAAGSAGIADFDQLKQLLNRHYETLYLDYDWPHIRFISDRIALSAGQRYYNVPNTFDYERIEKMVNWVSGRPYDVERGILTTDYAINDSDNDSRAGLVLKWDLKFTGTAEQIEVWPIPSGNDQELQVTAYRKFARLVADADLCRLDDNLIVAFAAAEVAPEEEAKKKLSIAQALYSRLKGRVKGAEKSYSFAGQPLPARKTFTVAVR